MIRRGGVSAWRYRKRSTRRFETKLERRGDAIKAKRKVVSSRVRCSGEEKKKKKTGLKGDTLSLPRGRGVRVFRRNFHATGGKDILNKGSTCWRERKSRSRALGGRARVLLLCNAIQNDEIFTKFYLCLRIRACRLGRSGEMFAEFEDTYLAGRLLEEVARKARRTIVCFSRGKKGGKGRIAQSAIFFVVHGNGDT